MLPTRTAPLAIPVNGHQYPDSTMPQPDPDPACSGCGTDRKEKPDPLTGGWITVAVVVGIMAALIAIGGMVLSFRAVSTEMIPAFGRQWSWLVPIVVDLTVFVFSGVDLVLARMDMSHPLARWTVYGATAGTVYLNYNATGALPGRVAHVLMPSIWVVFIELMRHVVRRQTNLATGSRREPIPTSRWLVSPWPTLKLWRRMVLWRVNSYPKALAQEKARLGAIAAARDLHGRAWRFRISPLLRLQIAQAEAGADEIYAHAVDAAAYRRSHDKDDAGHDAEGDTGDDSVRDTERDTQGDSVRDTGRDSNPDTDGDSAHDTEGDNLGGSQARRSVLLEAAREVERWRGQPSANRISRELGIGMPLAISLAGALRQDEGLEIPRPPAPARGRAKTPADKARDLRARHPGWTVEQIARSLGVSRQTASKYLNGQAGGNDTAAG
jgi:hypothetical protein